MGSARGVAYSGTTAVDTFWAVGTLCETLRDDRGAMAATSIRDVAVRARVSVGTVSNVLNRPDSVAPATRTRVQEAIDELGFVRNESARQLRAGRSRTVGLVVLDVANPFFTDLARGAEAVVDASSSVVIVCNSGQDAAREARHLDMLEQQRVLGVLITPVDERSERLERLIARGTPVVLVDRRSSDPQRCSVAVDDILGGRLAAEHLCERGHTRTAFVGGPLVIRQVAERYEGFATVVTARTGVAPEVVENGNLSVTAGRRAAEQLAELPPAQRPTAVFCANDLLAMGVLQHMTSRGLRVPSDLAIVGYDDIDYAAAAAVPLSSVGQPREELGRTAARMLLDEAQNPRTHRHRHVVFSPELVVRESSAELRAPP